MIPNLEVNEATKDDVLPFAEALGIEPNTIMALVSGGEDGLAVIYTAKDETEMWRATLIPEGDDDRWRVYGAPVEIVGGIEKFKAALEAQIDRRTAD